MNSIIIYGSLCEIRRTRFFKGAAFTTFLAETAPVVTASDEPYRNE